MPPLLYTADLATGAVLASVPITGLRGNPNILSYFDDTTTIGLTATPNPVTVALSVTLTAVPNLWAAWRP